MATTWKQVVVSSGGAITENTIGTASGLTAGTQLPLSQGGTGQDWGDEGATPGLVVNTPSGLDFITGSGNEVLKIGADGVPVFAEATFTINTDNLLTADGNNILDNLTVMGTFDFSAGAVVNLGEDTVTTDTQVLHLNHNSTTVNNDELLGLRCELTSADSSYLVYKHHSNPVTAGWKVITDTGSDDEEYELALLYRTDSSPEVEDLGTSGVGSMWLNTQTTDLYIRTS